MRRGSRRSAPAWAWRSPADCWRPPAEASGQRTRPTRERVSPLSFLAPPVPLPWWNSGMPVRILVVDDEPNILATLAPLLRSRGYEVSTAMTGRGAVEAVERENPDLMV